MSRPDLEILGAKTQADIVAAKMDKQDFVTEEIEHLLCQEGFVSRTKEGDVSRMDETLLIRTVRNLLLCRPAAHTVDVVPAYPYKETPVAVRNAAFFKMTTAEKAEKVAAAFLRSGTAAGFRMELHDVGGNKPSCTLVVYEITEPVLMPIVPVSIKITYRSLR